MHILYGRDYKTGAFTQKLPLGSACGWPAPESGCIRMQKVVTNINRVFVSYLQLLVGTKPWRYSRRSMGATTMKAQPRQEAYVLPHGHGLQLAKLPRLVGVQIQTVQV